MSKVKRKEGYYSISAVAKMFSVHQQTIRLYEKQGLISPKRSVGNTRLFSEADINRLEEVIYLTHELGINLAGVEMIFKLKKQMKKMQKEMNTIFESTQKELDKEAESSKEVIQMRAQRLLELKQEQPSSDVKIQKGEIEPFETKIDMNSWDIDYED